VRNDCFTYEPTGGFVSLLLRCQIAIDFGHGLIQGNLTRFLNWNKPNSREELK
jgi:hypothetical protein